MTTTRAISAAGAAAAQTHATASAWTLDAVCEVLAAVGIPTADIADERERMSEVAFGRTRNRSLLGTTTDDTLMAQHVAARRSEPETPQELVRFLARTPILPLEGARPIDLTRAAFRRE